MAKEITDKDKIIQLLEEIEEYQTDIYVSAKQKIRDGLNIVHLKAELEKHRWISVEEGLPEKADVYDVYDGESKWEEMFTKLDNGKMGWLRRNLAITHYRQIILPKELT